MLDDKKNIILEREKTQKIILQWIIFYEIMHIKSITFFSFLLINIVSPENWNRAHVKKHAKILFRRKIIFYFLKKKSE
jgi:hypothetical protein